MAKAIDNCVQFNVRNFKEGHAAMTAGLLWSYDSMSWECPTGWKRGPWSAVGVSFTPAVVLTVGQCGETINLANYVQRIPSSGMSAGRMV